MLKKEIQFELGRLLGHDGEYHPLNMLISGSLPHHTTPQPKASEVTVPRPSLPPTFTEVTMIKKNGLQTVTLILSSSLLGKTRRGPPRIQTTAKVILKEAVNMKIQMRGSRQQRKEGRERREWEKVRKMMMRKARRERKRVRVRKSKAGRRRASRAGTKSALIAARRNHYLHSNQAAMQCIICRRKDNMAQCQAFASSRITSVMINVVVFRILIIP